MSKKETQKKETQQETKDIKTNGNGKTLVIVESPAKAKTINKYLGGKFVVKASMGHVRDLPLKEFGVQLDKGFEPTYKVLPTRKKVVDDLKEQAKKAQDVYLATDLDREGEAIAWHLAKALGITETRAKRVIFNEITKKAIQQAFEHPHTLDLDKVNAQQARRILDRIVGYQLSPLLWKKIARNLSAGRVQSVAVRLIVEREQELEVYIPKENWEIVAVLHAGQKPEEARKAFLAYRKEREKETLEAIRKESYSESANNSTGNSKTDAFNIGDWLTHPEAGTFLEVIDNADPSLLKVRTHFWVECQVGKKAPGISKLETLPEPDALTDILKYIRPDIKKQKVVFEKHQLFKADLVKFDERPLGRLNSKQANMILGALRGARYHITEIEKKERMERPPAPFTTATLQQQAAQRLYFATQRTMRTAQQLYEGVDLGSQGAVALITYMRTDSTHLSAEALAAVRGYIGERFGAEYLPEKPNFYAAGKQAQEAHEAVRPTDVTVRPEDVKAYLTGDQYKLYDLIWRRFVACQMKPAVWDVTEAWITADGKGHQGLFKGVGRILKFAGFLSLQPERLEGADANLPPLNQGQDLASTYIEGSQHFTQPPPRFNEASLVRTLESQGIGRPSTYATIISTIQDRNYVDKKDNKFFPTDLGKVVTVQLIEHFPRVMDVKFTSHMEEQLDKIEEAHLDWVSVLNEFYEPFKESLEKATENMEKQALESPYACEQCGKPMLYRWTKNGRFLGCSGYPECQNTVAVDDEGKPKNKQNQVTDHKCPKCSKPMILRQSRYGTFLGCSGYPECKSTIPSDDQGNPLPKVKPNEVNVPCPECGKPMAAKRFKGRSFLGCSGYPTCKTTMPVPNNIAIDWPEAVVEKTDIKCDKCGAPMVKRFSRRGPFLGCSAFPKCRNIMKVAKEGDAAAPAGEDGKSAPKKERAAKKPLELTDVKCVKCGSPMAVRRSARGPFLGCSKYPKCKSTAEMPEEVDK